MSRFLDKIKSWFGVEPTVEEVPAVKASAKTTTTKATPKKGKAKRKAKGKGKGRGKKVGQVRKAVANTPVEEEIVIVAMDPSEIVPEGDRKIYLEEMTVTVGNKTHSRRRKKVEEQANAAIISSEVSSTEAAPSNSEQTSIDDELPKNSG